MSGRVTGWAIAAALIIFAVAPAKAQEIKIGFGMALTGGLAPNGKSALLGMKIWEDTINKKGGLLGRPVKLVYYDDQTNPSTVPGIYTKLLDVDKVDLVIGPYATNMIAPAMPVIIQKGKVFVAVFGLAVNSEFNYPKYFAMIPTGSEHQAVLHRRLLRRRGEAGSPPDDRCDRRGGCGIRAQCLRGRAREREEERLQHRLRPHLSAVDDRLHADHPRDPGNQSGCPQYLFVSAGFGRHGAHAQ